MLERWLAFGVLVALLLAFAHWTNEDAERAFPPAREERPLPVPEAEPRGDPEPPRERERPRPEPERPSERRGVLPILGAL